MSRPADDWSKSVSRLRDLLARIAVKCRDSGELVEEALGILNGSERSWRRGPGSAPGTGKRSRGDAVSEYRVEPGPAGMCLVEVRATGGQPFRCPERIFRATVETLAAAPDGLSFDDLRKSASKRLSSASADRPPIYLFRVVLRFLKLKLLIQHAGRRFRPQMSSTQFSTAARKAWRETESAPFKIIV